jgi:hypothetical protein
MVGEKSENLAFYESFNTFWGEVWRRAGGYLDFHLENILSRYKQTTSKKKI